MLHKAAKYWLRFIRVRAIYQQQAGSVRGGFTDAVVSGRKFMAVTGTGADGCGTKIVQLRNVNRKFYNSL